MSQLAESTAWIWPSAMSSATSPTHWSSGGDREDDIDVIGDAAVHEFADALEIGCGVRVGRPAFAVVRVAEVEKGPAQVADGLSHAPINLLPDNMSSAYPTM